MRRTFLYGVCVGTALLLPVSDVRVGNARKPGPTATNRVILDGRSYVPQPFPGGGNASLRRELERLGFTLPDGIEIPSGGNTGHPVYEERLLASPKRTAPPEVPPGLTADHAIRLEADGHSVELVFGRMAPLSPGLNARLQADGWVSHPGGNDPRNPRVLQKTRGKENAVACLDEAERTFLLIRKVGR
jgi:hypothetical protein